MNESFEDIFRKRINEGSTVEELAKMVTDVLNQINTEQKEAEAKAIEKKEAANKYIEQHEDQFWTHVKNERLTIHDAVNLLFLTVVKDTEFGRSIKTREELALLFKHIKGMADAIEDTFKLTREFDAIADMICSEHDNKSKENKEGGTGRDSVLDQDIIEDFLDKLFG